MSLHVPVPEKSSNIVSPFEQPQGLRLDDESNNGEGRGNRAVIQHWWPTFDLSVWRNLGYITVEFSDGTCANPPAEVYLKLWEGGWTLGGSFIFEKFPCFFGCFSRIFCFTINGNLVGSRLGVVGESLEKFFSEGLLEKRRIFCGG